MCGNSLPSPGASFCAALIEEVCLMSSPELSALCPSHTASRWNMSQGCGIQEFQGTIGAPNVASVVRAQAVNVNGATGQAFNLSL